MSKITTQLNRELRKTKPDMGLVNKLTHLISLDEVTLEDFRDTGRFKPRDVFKDERKKEILLPDCTDVVVYAGDFYIQALKTDEFVFKPNAYKQAILRSNSLDVLEDAMWELSAKKVINNIK